VDQKCFGCANVLIPRFCRRLCWPSEPTDVILNRLGIVLRAALKTLAISGTPVPACGYSGGICCLLCRRFVG
jgi:hypothetical protein